MKLGLGSYAYYWATGVPGYPPPNPMTTHDFLGRAAELGLKLVQIADNLPLHTLMASEIDALAERAHSLELEVEVGTRGINLDQLHVYLDLALRFGSGIVRTLLDTAEHHPSIDEAVATLRDIVPDFERAGVRLALENHDRLTAAQFAQIIEGIASDAVGICLDTVNSFGALEGPERVVSILAPYTVNLHLKEFTVQRSRYVMGFDILGKPAGEGRLNIPWLLEKIGDNGRQVNAIIELWPPPEDTIELTIAKEDTWVQKSTTYLRTLIPD